MVGYRSISGLKSSGLSVSVCVFGGGMLFVTIIVRSLLMFFHCVLGPVGLVGGVGVL